MEKDWKELKENLLSSVAKESRYVTQIIHFKDGVKRTFEGVSTDSIKQGQMTKLELNDGRYVLVNDENVLCIEVFSEE